MKGLLCANGDRNITESIVEIEVIRLEVLEADDDGQPEDLSVEPCTGRLTMVGSS